MKRSVLLAIAGIFFYLNGSSQIDEEMTGAWYMYFFNADTWESAVGFQGDIQYRNWNLAGDR